MYLPAEMWLPAYLPVGALARWVVLYYLYKAVPTIEDLYGGTSEQASKQERHSAGQPVFVNAIGMSAN